jgi:organic hydroperoxide reductase OsmC/OhrA
MMFVTSNDVPSASARMWRARTLCAGTVRARGAGMPAPFPHRYKTSLVRTLSSRARIEAPPRAPILAGPPPELDGDATSWSPELLLLSSIGMCLLTTFEAFAVRDQVDLFACDVRAFGTVDKTPHGLRFTSFTVEVDMEVSDVVRAQQTLEVAKQHCMVSNALVTPVEVIATFRPLAQQAG